MKTIILLDEEALDLLNLLSNCWDESVDGDNWQSDQLVQWKRRLEIVFDAEEHATGYKLK